MKLRVAYGILLLAWIYLVVIFWIELFVHNNVNIVIGAFGFLGSAMIIHGLIDGGKYLITKWLYKNE